jgi:BirA family biotin operon repressor/biotin-[acetyl-CoA-carboxylase] ligase
LGWYIYKFLKGNFIDNNNLKRSKVSMLDLVRNNTENRTNWLGHSLHSYSEVVSTNQHARRLAELDAPAGTVVIADRQTGGEGRKGRKWLSGEGGLWFSVILKPTIQLEITPTITLMASVAIAEAIENFTRLKPGIKWPNDIMVNGRKVCGILTELITNGEESYSIVVGIGINVNISNETFGHELGSIATSLSSELNRDIEKNEFFQECLYQMEKWYTTWQDKGFQPIKEAWKKHNITLGQNVKLSSCDEVFFGHAYDMDYSGALLVRDLNGDTRKFNYGEVSLRKA